MLLESQAYYKMLVSVGVVYLLSSLTSLSSSLAVTFFAFGPCFLVETRLPRNTLVAQLASPPGKCLEHTRVFGFTSFSCLLNTSSQSVLLSAFFGILWNGTLGSLVLVFPQTQHQWAVIIHATICHNSLGLSTSNKT